MLRPALAYGAAGAAASLLLAWLDWRHMAHGLSGELHVTIIALAFAALGIWLGLRLSPRTAPAPFRRNTAAMATLGISAREMDVLDLLALGHANKVIARKLAISPNTVKTHLARLFDKLGATTRTGAIANARGLGLLP